MLCSCFYHQLAAEIWSTSHDGVSDFCPSCALLTQAVDESWVATAMAHRKMFFPMSILKHSAELIQAVNVSLTQVSDGQDTLRGELFKVAVLNMSFLGPEGVKMRGEMKTVLSTLVSCDEVKTCALVVAPVTGEYGAATDEGSIEKVGRDLLDDLRDDSGLAVKIVTVMFDSETMWSESRSMTHIVFMCISKKMESGKFISAFAKSKAWIRGALQELVRVMPRHELVNPTVRIATGDQSNLSKERERKQWVTGPSFWNAVAHSVWTGMGTNSKHIAVWLDLLPYDGHLPMSCISRSGVQVTVSPTEFCASFVWANPAADNKAIENFIEKLVMSHLKTQCTSKAYCITGAPDLAGAASGVAAGSRTSPTYNEGTFKLTKPMADRTLPVRKSLIDKWLAPGVPSSLKDEFRAVVTKHDSEFNASGIAWVGDQDTKRKATDELAGANATTLAPHDGCPKNRAEIQTKYGDIKLKQMTGWNLLVTDDGTIFAEGLTSVQAVLASESVAMASGEWVVAGEYDKCKKSGIRRSQLQVSLKTRVV